MVRNLNVTDDIFLTRSYVGKHRCQQVIGTNTLNLWRHFLPVLESQQRQRAVRVPTPTRAVGWRGKGVLLQDRLHRLGNQEVESECNWKARLLSKSDSRPVVSRRGLQLKLQSAVE